MNIKYRNAVILDYLIPLHITYINKVFDLKRLGKTAKEINLYSINPLTGKNEINASIIITLNIDSGYSNDFADLLFWINNRQINQRIELIAKKAPIDNGNTFYFKCPVTAKKRRTLYLFNERFVAKQAIENPHYLSQTQSRKQRNGIKKIKRIVSYQNIVKQGEKKYFKKYYGGNLTKRYMKILDANDSLNASW